MSDHEDQISGDDILGSVQSNTPALAHCTASLAALPSDVSVTKTSREIRGTMGMVPLLHTSAQYGFRFFYEDIPVIPDLQVAIKVGQISQLVVYVGPLQMILIISGNPSPRWRRTGRSQNNSQRISHGYV